MIPGMGRGMNPRQMKQMMKRMGITTEELEATEVIIRLEDKELVIKDPAVTAMNVKGDKTFQIVGECEERELSQSTGTAGPSVPEEDIELVSQQAGVSKEKAKKALEESDGDLAEAIVSLQS